MGNLYERIAGWSSWAHALTAALRRSRGYFVGGKMFPSAHVDEHDIRAVLERYFRREDLTIEVRELADVESKGLLEHRSARAHHRGSCGGFGLPQYGHALLRPWSRSGGARFVSSREWRFGAS